jgi:hypothetical protein
MLFGVVTYRFVVLVAVVIPSAEGALLAALCVFVSTALITSGVSVLL